MVPGYIKLKEEGTLDERLKELEKMADPCTLCARRCNALRKQGRLGYCQAPFQLYVSSAFPHFGEERPLVGSGGSGTIFLTHCNLRCVFCQNYEISFYGDGAATSILALANMMIRLQEVGCHNINFVTPTHYVPHIVRAVSLAVEIGLRVPLVYNCGGYESLEVVRLLEGIFDIYMPDIKFLDPQLSQRYLNARDYPEVVREVVREMQRQVGDLRTNTEGVAERGLIIRHLVMPSHIEDTKEVLRFVREQISENAFVNIMAQYHPCHRAFQFPEISRRITRTEYMEALEFAKNIGLKRAATH